MLLKLTQKRRHPLSFGADDEVVEDEGLLSYDDDSTEGVSIEDATTAADSSEDATTAAGSIEDASIVVDTLGRNKSID